MRRFAIYAVVGTLALACGLNEAVGQTATGTGTANSSSSSGAIAIGGSSSVVFNTPSQQHVNSNVRYRQSGSLSTTPNAIAPGLGSAGVESCSTPGVSGAVSVTGFGFGAGASTIDKDCNVRLYSRTLYAMGHRQAALQLLINESGMVQRAFGVGSAGAAVTPRGLIYAEGAQPVRSRAAVAVGGCSKWRDNVVGLQCVY